MTGTRLGNWILQEPLGRGSSGVVYRAQRFDGSAPEAAVKVLDAALSREPAFQQRFPGELLALHRLTHPNLTRFHDAGVQAGMVYYACELAPGRSLDVVLNSRDRGEPGLPWAAVWRIAVQAARALKHAHHRSILHRDLKPANLVLADDGTLKVTDFGVAKAFNIPPLALPVEPMGTACYLAPEHFTGKPLTRKSDLYALGGVLYTLVCGRAPFHAASAAEYMHKHCYMLPDRPQNFVPKLPLEVDDLICALMAKDPAKRPASAAALLDELEHLRGKLERKGERLLLPPEIIDPTGLHAPLPAVSEPPPSGNDSARARGRILSAGLFGVLFLAVVGVILFAFFRPRPSAEELWNQAQPLLASDNPDDWDRARAESLDKLERWHPGAYGAELTALRERVNDRRELRRALATGSTFQASSEAERLYRKGLAFAQVGDLAAAKEMWRSMPPDNRWSAMAAAGLREIELLSTNR